MAIKKKLLRAFRKGIDGQNSNAYARVLPALKEISSKNQYSLSDLIDVIDSCSMQWDDEIDSILN